MPPPALESNRALRRTIHRSGPRCVGSTSARRRRTASTTLPVQRANASHLIRQAPHRATWPATASPRAPRSFVRMAHAATVGSLRERTRVRPRERTGGEPGATNGIYLVFTSIGQYSDAGTAPDCPARWYRRIERIRHSFGDRHAGLAKSFHCHQGHRGLRADFRRHHRTRTVRPVADRRRQRQGGRSSATIGCHPPPRSAPWPSQWRSSGSANPAS